MLESMEGLRLVIPTHTQSSSGLLCSIFSQLKTDLSIWIDVDVTLRACDQSRLSQCPESPAGLTVVCRRRFNIGCEHNEKLDLLFSVLPISVDDCLDEYEPLWPSEESSKIPSPNLELLSHPKYPSVPPVRYTSLIGFLRPSSSILSQTVHCTAGKSGLPVHRYVETGSQQLPTRRTCCKSFVLRWREAVDHHMRLLKTGK